jgi:hypothetical protein
MKIKETAIAIGQVVGIAVSIFFISFVVFAWVGPTSNPPEGNITFSMDSVEGDFEVGGNLTVHGYLESTVPAFSVTLSDHITYTGVIIWNRIGINNGGHYNSATGEFTAPVAGLYQFCFGGMAYPYGCKRPYADVQKNEVRIPGGRVYAAGFNAPDYDFSYKCVLDNLVEGDKIRVVTSRSDCGWYADPYTNFTGHLITTQ